MSRNGSATPRVRNNLATGRHPAVLERRRNKDKTVFQDEWKNLLSHLSNLEISSPPTTNKKKKVHAACPEFFNGDSKQYEDWWRDIDVYVIVAANDINDDEDKILFVLSYLKGSTADKYKQNWLDTQQDSDTNEILINDSFCSFMRELDKTFTPVNKQEDAQKWLEELVQGSQTAEQFF